MSTSTSSAANPLSKGAFALPNQLTVLRLLLSLVLFAMVAYGAFFAAFILFIIAVSTDWIDGHIARKYGLVTILGRILDPFVDKVIICGTFVFLLAVPESTSDLGKYLRAWMVVLVIGRELLITSIRGFLEQRGQDFSATMVGKLKMVFQCVAIGACLFYLAYGRNWPWTPPVVGAGERLANVVVTPLWITWSMIVSLWASVAITVYSGLIYVQRAFVILGR